MTSAGTKHILMVDDDAAFLSTACELLTQISHGAWEIAAASDHAQALALLAERPFAAAILDFQMPGLDGLQLLQLFQRIYPALPIAILTGASNPGVQARSLAAGARLFLVKSAEPGAFETIFRQVDTLASAPVQAGFQGLMRRVGLPEVLQLECLGGKSSILEVFAPGMQGRIYVADGSIVHAETGSLAGERALYSLLALQGGGFNLLPYEEPLQRTIAGPWEFLLMEAARLIDEAGSGSAQAAATAPVEEPLDRADQPRIVETLLCSGGGELLHHAGEGPPEARRSVLGEFERQGRQLAARLPLGELESVELLAGEERCLMLFDTSKKLFLRRMAPAHE